MQTLEGSRDGPGGCIPAPHQGPGSKPRLSTLALAIASIESKLASGRLLFEHDFEKPWDLEAPGQARDAGSGGAQETGEALAGASTDAVGEGKAFFRATGRAQGPRQWGLAEGGAQGMETPGSGAPD